MGLLTGTAEKVAMVLLAAAGVYGVWRVPNKAPE